MPNQANVTGTFTGAASSAWFASSRGKLAVRLEGASWVGVSVKLETSSDQGVTVSPATTDSIGTAAVYTSPIGKLVVEEPDDGVLYRWTCTAFTSGTVKYGITQSSTPYPR